MGLWNVMARHQYRSRPLRLVRVEAPATRAGLADIALIRREELDGFAEGLFGPKKSIQLPERAHCGLEAISELRGIFDDLHGTRWQSCEAGHGAGRRRTSPLGPRPDEGGRTRDPRGRASFHARPTATAEHGADHETAPALTVIRRCRRPQPTLLTNLFRFASARTMFTPR
jgi:hypothetical protein